MAEKKLFREPSHNVYVPSELTADEKALSEKLVFLRAEQTRITDEYQAALVSCDHKIWHDVAGIPYDTRFCGVCNRRLETI